MSEVAEQEIRALTDAGDHDGATTATLRDYGPEVFSFLIVRMRAEDRAAEVFSQMCEDLWKSMPAFEWRCSMRSWIYKLARNAAVRFERTPANQHGRRVALSQISEIADRVRSQTLAHRRSEVKDELQKIREELDPDEQTLLVLRVDRDLGWNEIAEIMEEPGDAEELAKASARLRQRFQKLKERLRELAEKRGLIPAG
jgi:RNA polymerase sigma-70 factor (ECF subfamily)